MQDILFNNAANTYEAVVKRGGHFYVCGDVSMANDVTKTLQQILALYGGMQPEEAKNFVLKLKVQCTGCATVVFFLCGFQTEGTVYRLLRCFFCAERIVLKLKVQCKGYCCLFSLC